MAKKDRLQHVAIIMDGNGRWAERRGLPRSAGHRAGADAVMRAVDAAREFGIHWLTLYAFSTENWKRPVDEVRALMHLLEEFLDAKLPEMRERKLELRAIGRIAGLPAGARKKLLAAVEATRGNPGGTLVLALNYGGRAELADAARAIARKAAAGELSPEKIDEDTLAAHLYDPAIPEPELLIRTSGELRLSNFLLWQLAYSEFYVTDVLWPDFGREEFANALESYRRRDRRFGGVK